MAADSEQATYHPQDTLGNALVTGMQTGAAGAVLAGVQNTMRKQNVGAMGILTRSGGMIAVYVGAGAAYQFFKDASSNLRQKEDGYSEAIGGAAAGVAVGISRRSIPFTLGAAVAFATGVSAFKYVQGFRGNGWSEKDVDEVARKEAAKKLRRRPLSETIEQLGEGRGIYAPGYEERRRQRLMAKYGIDVKEAQEKFQQKNVDVTASAGL